MTVSELIEWYWDGLTCKCPHSVESQSKNVSHVLGKRDAATLTTQDLLDYRQIRRTHTKGPNTKATIKDSTINRELGYLRAAVKKALACEILIRQPNWKAGMAPEPPPREGMITLEQLETLLDCLLSHNADAVEFMFWTGWRKRAVLDLEWPTVNWSGEWVRLPGVSSKNGHPVQYPLEGAVREILERRRGVSQWARQTVPFIFHRDGERIDGFRRNWATAARHAGLVGIHIHDLRRSFVDHMLNLPTPIPEKVVMELCGMRTRSILDRYHIVRREALKMAVSHAAMDRRNGVEKKSG